MASRKKRVGIEWVGGVVAMPAYITGEGEPYRPELVVWMRADGPVVGFEMGKPGAMLAAEPSHLRATIHSPMFGEPHTPDRIRVASGELARALRDALPSALEIVCGPTPEIDHLVASMSEHTSEERIPMGWADDGKPSRILRISSCTSVCCVIWYLKLSNSACVGRVP